MGVKTSGGSGAGKGAAQSDKALAAELAQAKNSAAAQNTLKKIAQKCEKRVTNKLKKKGVSFPLSGQDCRNAGIAKHKCCEKMVKAAGNPPVQAEVPLDSAGKDVSEEYRKARKMASRVCRKAGERGLNTKGMWGTVFKANAPNVSIVADVVFTDQNGQKFGFDFKFPCGTNPPKWGKNGQKRRYSKIFGAGNIGLISP